MAILVQSNKKPSVSYPSQTGSIVTFNSQYAGLPLKSHKIALTATQSGSGTPSLENERPINGYSELGINTTGKNLIRCNISSGTYNGVTFTVNEDLSITTSGEYQDTPIPFIYSYLVTLRAGTYILNGCPSGGSYSDYVVRIENSSAQRIALDTGNGETFTLTEDTPVFCRIYIYSQNGVGKTFYPMVRMVNTNSDYEPFGTYTTINLGGTYYGGEYDARTGVLMVTHGILDLGSITWRYNTTSRVFLSSTGTPSASVMKRYSNAVVANALCDIFKPTSFNDMINNDVDYSLSIANALTNGIHIKDSDYTDATAFETAMNGHMLVYELATPITIQLPPCPIDVLEGVNNIWADTGETTAEYIKIGG